LILIGDGAVQIRKRNQEGVLGNHQEDRIKEGKAGQEIHLAKDHAQRIVQDSPKNLANNQGHQVDYQTTPDIQGCLLKEQTVRAFKIYYWRSGWILKKRK
jgi:hypothetical protein